MNVLICPDSFKGTLTSIEASEIIGKVLEDKGFNVILKPIADGGDGTIDVIEYSSGGKKNYSEVINPVRDKIKTYYLTIDETAYIEYAKSSGILLLNQDELNPITATSYGFGELIKDALIKGFKKITLTLGGSATNDAGIGMLQALGVKFYDADGYDLSRENKDILDASNLINVNDFDLSDLQSLIKGIRFEILSDVKNPLTGTDGATYVFGKQKGASDKNLEELENGILHFSGIVRAKLSKEMNFSGAGAAGGVGGSAKTFLNAEIKSGINEIIRILKVEKEILNSDIVIVGEGSMDFQTSYGKAPIGIAEIAKKHKKAVIGVTGKIGNNAEELLNKGFDCILSSYGNVDLDFDVVKKNARYNLKMISEKLAEIILSKSITHNIIQLNK